MKNLSRTVTGIVMASWIVGAAAACGPPSNPDGGGGDGSVMGDATPMGDGTGGGGDTGGMTDTGGGGNRGVGTVSISQNVIMAAGMSFVSSSASATFVNATGGSGGGGNCTMTTMGECQVTECTVMPSDAGTGSDAGMVTPVNAGAITITGGAIPMGSPITLMPGANGLYMPFTGMTRLWMGAGMLHVTAAGMSGGVPMFDQMLATPGDVTITAPMVTPPTPLAINRSMPFDARWTGGTSGRVNVNLTASMSSGGTTHATTVVCRYMAAAGMGSVPSAALMRLPTGMGVFSIGASSDAMVAAGNYDVTISATQSGLAGQATFN